MPTNFSGFDLLFYLGVGSAVALMYLFSMFMMGHIGTACKACGSFRTHIVTNQKTYENITHCFACESKRRKRRERERSAALQSLGGSPSW